MDVTLGQLVYSKAGRDAGKKFIIVEIIDELYVTVSDGSLRRLEKPKKKKIKHLELTGKVVTSLSEKFINKLKVTNSEIRKALAAVENKSEGNDSKENWMGD